MRFYFNQIMNEKCIPDAKHLTKLCFDKFADIGKSGKPVEAEQWTALTCIAQLDAQTDRIEIVSLGTGESFKLRTVLSYCILIVKIDNQERNVSGNI